MVQNSESHEQEEERQRNHQQLKGVIAALRENARKLYSMPLEVSQSPPEKHQPVSQEWFHCVDA